MTITTTLTTGKVDLTLSGHNDPPRVTALWRFYQENVKTGVSPGKDTISLFSETRTFPDENVMKSAVV